MNINTDNPVIDLPFPNTEFLSTSAIIKMNGPMGFVNYLEMIETPIKESTEEDSPLGFGGVDQSMAQISLGVKKHNLDVKTYSIESKFAQSQAEDMATFGVDISLQMSSVLANEAKLQMENQLLEIYQKIGESSEDPSLNKWRKFLKRTFKLEFPYWIEPQEINNKIASILIKRSNWIATKSRRGPANFCIVGPELGTYIQESPQFLFKEVSGVDSHAGIRFIGNLGNLKVFVNPVWKFNEKTVVLGKSTQDSNPGVYFGQWTMNLLKVMSEETMNWKYAIRPRYTMDEIGDLKSGYSTFRIELSKKPFWRRLIGA